MATEKMHSGWLALGSLEQTRFWWLPFFPVEDATFAHLCAVTWKWVLLKSIGLDKGVWIRVNSFGPLGLYQFRLLCQQHLTYGIQACQGERVSLDHIPDMVILMAEFTQTWYEVITLFLDWTKFIQQVCAFHVAEYFPMQVQYVLDSFRRFR